MDDINITIRSKLGIVFKDRVKSVSSYNEKGLFDILAKHENFISLIKEKIVIHKNDNQKEEIKIDNGVMKVYENNVNIYIGI